MARAAYTLTIREGPRVSRHPHETLEGALDDLRGELDRLAGEGGLPEVKMIRTFSPDKRVKARLEISTGGLLRRREAGVDLMGDGAVVPYRGGVFKHPIEPLPDDWIAALGEALEGPQR